MIIDTICETPFLQIRWLKVLLKLKKFLKDDALQKLEEMTPLAKIVPDAKPKPVIKEAGATCRSC